MEEIFELLRKNWASVSVEGQAIDFLWVSLLSHANRLASTSFTALSALQHTSHNNPYWSATTPVFPPHHPEHLHLCSRSVDTAATAPPKALLYLLQHGSSISTSSIINNFTSLLNLKKTQSRILQTTHSRQPPHRAPIQTSNFHAILFLEIVANFLRQPQLSQVGHYVLRRIGVDGKHRLSSCFLLIKLNSPNFYDILFTVSR